MQQQGEDTYAVQPPPVGGSIPPPPSPRSRPNDKKAAAIVGGVVGVSVVLFALLVLFFVAVIVFMVAASLQNTGDGYLFRHDVSYSQCAIEASGASTTVSVTNPLEDADLTNVVIEVSFGYWTGPRDREWVAAGEVRLGHIAVGETVSGEVQGEFFDSPPDLNPTETPSCRWTDIDYDVVP